MSQFTCINCQVAFKNVDLQRDHYKTDWHRYNLKRKIAELPPVTAEEFQRRISLIHLENENKSRGKDYTYCSVCKKSFSSHKSFQNHMQSKRHVDMLKNVEHTDQVNLPSVKNEKTSRQHVDLPVEEMSDNDSIETASSGTEELDSDEWEEFINENNPILRNDCLFCTHHSASLTKNVKHMSVAHSFFIPYIEYLDDLKGLLLYLGEKICQGLICIWCNDRKASFSNIEAVRNHMIHKGHTKIASDTEASLEYLDFYNFNVMNNDEDCNLDDNHDELIYEAETPKLKAEEADAVTMVLPSGDTICHRSLIKYFR